MVMGKGAPVASASTELLLLLWVLPSRTLIANVWAVEGGHQPQRGTEAELQADVILDTLRGGGGECHDGDALQL